MTAWKAPQYHRNEKARLRHAIADARGELSRTAFPTQMTFLREKIAKLRKRLAEYKE